MTKILLSGTGITSALCCSILRREIPNIDLVIWDKAKGTGGRMSTSRCSETNGAADLGAQYITSSPEYLKKHSSYYSELKTNNILKPLSCTIGGMKTMAEGTEHFVTPNGSSSLVKYYLENSMPTIKFNHHILDINDTDGLWKVTTNSGEVDSFDAVILTMPVPQILKLEGAVKDVIDSDNEIKKNLSDVEYSSRFSLALFFCEEDKVKLDGDVAVQYIYDDPILRYVSLDNEKRGQGKEPTSVVIHTSVPFGLENVETSLLDMESILMEHVQKKFPQWPKPTKVKCHKWRYSQVTKPYSGSPGCVELCSGLVAGGDGFSHSNLDGCIESAESICSSVIEFIKNA